MSSVINTPMVILYVKGRREALSHAALSVATFAAMIGTGALLDSDAMQWVGAILGFLFIGIHAIRLAKDNRMTIPEARKRLDEIEMGWK